MRASKACAIDRFAIIPDLDGGSRVTVVVVVGIKADSEPGVGTILPDRLIQQIRAKIDAEAIGWRCAITIDNDI